MSNLEGKKCPAFQGECTNNKTFSNKDFSNKNLVIYFYPKDSTPGCTTEGQDFRDNYKEFKKYDTEILGVSRDCLLYTSPSPRDPKISRMPSSA